MLNNLHPIRGGHSINRSTISLYLPQEVIRPEKLFEKVNQNLYFSSHYQRRSLIYSRVISFKNEKSSLSIVDEKLKENIIGFIFEQFNDSGEIENIITLQNDEDKASISFETRKYVNWENFSARFLEDFNHLISQHEFYFEALSLTYIDEFIWKSEDKIPVEDIFDKDSELLNSKFLKSNNGTIALYSQNEDNNIEEKTEISFNNDLKRIQIIHQHATKFIGLLDSATLLKQSNINMILDVAHLSNKETLNDLLTIAIKDMINLK